MYSRLTSMLRIHMFRKLFAMRTFIVSVTVTGHRLHFKDTDGTTLKSFSFVPWEPG